MNECEVFLSCDNVLVISYNSCWVFPVFFLVISSVFGYPENLWWQRKMGFSKEFAFWVLASKLTSHQLSHLLVFLALWVFFLVSKILSFQFRGLLLGHMYVYVGESTCAGYSLLVGLMSILFGYPENGFTTLHKGKWRWEIKMKQTVD
jgi:hypothetical protein